MWTLASEATLTSGGLPQFVHMSSPSVGGRPRTLAVERRIEPASVSSGHQMSSQRGPVVLTS